MVDGTSTTILILEANYAVEWSKPDELEWLANAPRPSAIPSNGGPTPLSPSFWVIMADGLLNKVKRTAPDISLWRLFIRNDGMAIANDWEHLP